MERAGSVAENLTKILALVLPVSQLFARYLPESLRQIYLGSTYFLPVSIIVLLICISLWLILSAWPYFEIPLRPNKHRKYQDAITQQKRQEANQARGLGFPLSITEELPPKPFYVTVNNLQLFAFVSAVIFSITFLWIGITVQQASGLWIIAQSISYVLAIVSFFLVLVIHAQRKRNIEGFNSIEASRAQNAINRATELRGFIGMPIVNYIGMEQIAEPVPGGATHVVYVSVDTESSSTRYRIGTDYYGTIVYWVLTEQEIAASQEQSQLPVG